jgi:hypothetical protein
MFCPQLGSGLRRHEYFETPGHQECLRYREGMLEFCWL